MMDNARYRIIRFRQGKREVPQGRYGRLTLAEARRICSRDDAYGGNPDEGTGWFLGYRRIS